MCPYSYHPDVICMTIKLPCDRYAGKRGMSFHIKLAMNKRAAYWDKQACMQWFMLKQRGRYNVYETRCPCWWDCPRAAFIMCRERLRDKKARKGVAGLVRATYACNGMQQNRYARRIGVHRPLLASDVNSRPSNSMPIVFDGSTTRCCCNKKLLLFGKGSSTFLIASRMLRKVSRNLDPHKKNI